MTTQVLFSVKELSSYLGVSPCTIYRLVKKKEIPFIKRSGLSIRFQKQAIDEWLEKSAEKPLADALKLLNAQTGPLTLPPESSIKKSHGKSGGIGEMAKAKSKSRINCGYGAVYQRKTKSGNVRWYIDYKDSTGKRKQELVSHALTEEEAVVALQRKVALVFSREQGIERKKERVTFVELADIYLEDYAKVNKAVKSWKTDGYYLKGMKEFFGTISVGDISPHDVERYKAHRLKQGVRTSTINRCLAILRKMFNLAVEWGYLQNNPIKRVKFYSERDNLQERILLPEEEKRLFEVSPDGLRPVLTIALNSGMRLGEILNLKWEQIDLDSKTIRVENTKSKRNRTIEINSTLRAELQKLKDHGNCSPYLFANPKTGKPLTTVKRAFKTACKKAGISGLRFHDMRHTFATRLIAKGTDIITVKELLGHSSVTITERYTHSFREQKKKAVELLVEIPLIEAQKEESLLHIRDTAESFRPISSSYQNN
jgi:excisionase family DNA binding protein